MANNNDNDNPFLYYKAPVGYCSYCNELIMAKFTAMVNVEKDDKPTTPFSGSIGGTSAPQLLPVAMYVSHECDPADVQNNAGINTEEKPEAEEPTNRYPAELWCSISYPVEEGYSQTKWDHFKDGVYHLRKDKVDAAAVEADFDSLVRSTPYAVDPSSNYNYSLMGKKDEETRRGELGTQA